MDCLKKMFVFPVFLAVLGVCRCAWAFCTCRGRGLLSAAVPGPVFVGAALAAERRVQVRGLLRGCHVGSAAVAHGLSTTRFIVVAHELIFTNLGPLHWHVDSLSLDFQRSPGVDFCLTSSEQGRVHPVHFPTTH